MKHKIILLLQAFIVLFGIGTFILMLWFPQTEGRAANLNLISIYKDPFIIYIYIASIAFFMGVYQVFNLLGYIDKNKMFSEISVNAVQTIKYCAMIIIGFMIGAEAYIIIVMRRIEEDIAGGVAMGIFIMLISLLIAAVASVFETYLRNNTHIKQQLT